MERLALVTTGRCPVMVMRSPSAASLALAFVSCSPRPMFSVTFSTVGTAIGFLKSNSLIRAGTTSDLYRSFNRGAILLTLVQDLAAVLTAPHPRPVGQGGVGDACGPVAVGANDHDV